MEQPRLMYKRFNSVDQLAQGDLVLLVWRATLQLLLVPSFTVFDRDLEP